MRTRLYFAYGSNMDPAQMLVRCPGAVRVERGFVRHRRFVINRRGVATLACERNTGVWGGVWSITARDEAMLDRFEGFPNRYGKERISVTFGDGGSCKALAYIDPVTDEGLPREGYLPRILRGARSFRLPKDYIASIAEPFFQQDTFAIAC